MDFDFNFLVGLVGALVLVVGAAWPVKKVVNPRRSVKNWLFVIGGLLMLFYAWLGYLTGGSVFFVFLQVLVNVASVLMMTNVSDRISAWVLGLCGAGLVGWSLWLFEGVGTVLFVLGLVGIAFGYAFENGSKRRLVALTLGSILVALFSYLMQDWVFFGLNVVFAGASGWWLRKRLLR